MSGLCTPHFRSRAHLSFRIVTLLRETGIRGIDSVVIPWGAPGSEDIEVQVSRSQLVGCLLEGQLLAISELRTFVIEHNL